MVNDPDNMGKPLAKTFIVCGALIEKDGKFLLVQEKKPSAFELWNFPGGKVDEGETLEEAVLREVKEECGLQIELIRKLHTIHQDTNSPVIHTYLASIDGGSLVWPESEIIAAEWFSVEEIRAMSDKLRNKERMLGALDALNDAGGN